MRCSVAHAALTLLYKTRSKGAAGWWFPLCRFGSAGGSPPPPATSFARCRFLSIGVCRTRFRWSAEEWDRGAQSGGWKEEAALQKGPAAAGSEYVY